MTRASLAAPRPRLWGRLVVAAAVIVGLVGVAPASRAETYEERALRQAKDRVAQVEQRLDRARGQAEIAREELDRLQEDVAVLDAAVNAAVDAVAQQAAEVERAAARLAQLQHDADELEADLTTQLVALFKRGSASRFETVMGAHDVVGAIQRAEFVRVLTSGERALLEGLRNSRILVSAQRERYDAEQARLLQYEAEQRELFERATATRDAAAEVLRGLQRDVALLQGQKDDLAQDAEALRRLIAQNAAAPTSGLAPSTSGYIWPICGVVTSGYGRRWGRMHEGIDIDGDTGDVIAASKDGVVIFAGRQGGYGNLTLIDHGDGVVTAYGHQSQFFVGRGDAVVRGQKIGAVGNTGQSTGPHLHFETRVNGDPQDPRRFLSRGC